MTTTEHQKLGTKKRLIQAGIEIFAANGFNGTTTRMLAEKANANLSAIPYHFQSKEGLYLAVFEHISDRISTNLDTTLCKVNDLAPPPNHDPEKARSLLQEFLTAEIEFVCGSPEAELFAQIILREQMSPSSAFDIIYPKNIKPILDALSRIIAMITGETIQRTTLFQAFIIMGQIIMFRAARETICRHLGLDGYSRAETEEIKKLVSQWTHAALDGSNPGNSIVLDAGTKKQNTKKG